MNPLNVIAPSSKSIQKEYVDKRLRQIAKDEKGRADPLKTLVLQMQAQRNIDTEWTNTYLQILQRLQGADLTINVDAGSWFHAGNRYANYTQIYERGVGSNGQMTLRSNASNEADARAVADDLVTIPEEWANAHRFSQRKRLYDAMNLTGARNSAGAGAVVKKHGKLDPATHHPKLVGDDTAGFQTSNRKFKPKAREVFAALNYGRRMHGACVEYGWSHLILDPELKKRAIYYPADTFLIADLGTATQCSYTSIGSLLLGAKPVLRNDIWRSCHDGQALPDSGSGLTLVEAHIFRKIKVAEDVHALVLSRQRRKPADPAWSEGEWRTIIANATDWCRRNSVRLLFSSD